MGAIATKNQNFNIGDILSETSFFTVSKVQPNGDITVKDDLNNEVTISKQYAEQILHSANNYSKEEQKTLTELADILISHSRIAMTVCFIKKATAKTKKVFEAEKQAKIAEIQSTTLANAGKLLEDLIENPISKEIPGETRVIRGRHYGHIDDLGRVHFVDMEIPKTTNEGTERMRQIDPRTIQYIIVNNTKYNLKK